MLWLVICLLIKVVCSWCGRLYRDNIVIPTFSVKLKRKLLFFSPAFHQVLIVPRLKADWFHAHFGCWLHPLDIVFCFLRRLFSKYQAVGCFLWQGVGRCIVTDSRAWALPCQLKDIRPIKWHEFHLRRLARSQPFFGNIVFSNPGLTIRRMLRAGTA